MLKGGDPASACDRSVPVARRMDMGRECHCTVDGEGFPIAILVHAADGPDRDGAPGGTLSV